ncbi:MAG: hypothetical protein MJZ52_00415 [Bacteroidales bacterium]|nr:hypothetical protein [Bacteroidales bacterium]
MAVETQLATSLLQKTANIALGGKNAHYLSHASLTIPTNRNEGGRSGIPTPNLHCSL